MNILQQTWTFLREHLLAGVMTLLFGGILGALFLNWLNRPLPELSVSSISFDNTVDKNLVLPSVFLGEMNKRIRFDSRMSWRDIRNVEVELGDLLIDLRELSKKTEDWLTRNRSGNDVIPEHELVKFPPLASQAYMDLFVETIHANGTSGPVTTSKLEKGIDPYEVGLSQSSSPNLRFLGAMLDLDLDALDGRSITAFNNFLFSLRKGNRANLSHFGDALVVKNMERINRYTEVMEELNSFLMKSSRIAITMTVYNNGKDPVLLHPYFKLDISNQSTINEDYLLSTINWRMEEMKPLNDYIEEFSELIRRDYEVTTERRVNEPRKYSSFFQNGETFPHISVKGGSTVTVVLETSEALGEEAEAIRKLYESEALSCGITGIRTDGELIESRDFMFSPKINQAVKDALYQNSR